MVVLNGTTMDEVKNAKVKYEKRKSNVGKNWSDSNELSTEWFKTKMLGQNGTYGRHSKDQIQMKKKWKKTVNAVLTEYNFPQLKKKDLKIPG